ncbi:2-dehydropantoate 2-reductase [Halalkalibacter okhensis]|uniref:2-dehydropantoate 2-reductase n=1 Tax=Halalkalibacter okhensis TaxID=333138 RepID=UPI00068AF7DF|nr:2-dehydropantoate 2-reductase [Halalkalibacter okhensis]
MKVVVLGSGSIGMLVAFNLIKQGHSTLLVTNRNEQANCIKEERLHLIREDGVNESIHVDVESFSTLKGEETIDLLIVTVKSYQVEQVIKAIQASKLSISSVLFLQNGMAHTELLPMITIPEVAVGVVEHGALRINDYTVHHTGVGLIRWSYVRENNKMVEGVLKESTEGRFRTKYEQKWEPMLQHKLVVNACINPLTALFGIRNGELVQNSHYNMLLRQVFDEIMKVIDLGNAGQMWEYVCNISEKTGANRSSMLSDLENKRKTEIDSIVGYLLRKAAKKQLNTPILVFLYEAIKGKEKEYMLGEANVCQS